jgi:hypothetical protein
LVEFGIVVIVKVVIAVVSQRFGTVLLVDAGVVLFKVETLLNS